MTTMLSFNGPCGNPNIEVKGPFWVWRDEWAEDLDDWYGEEATIFAAFWLSEKGLAWQLRAR